MRNAFDIGAANFCAPAAQSRIPSQSAPLLSSLEPQQSPAQSRIPSNTQPISAARIPSEPAPLSSSPEPAQFSLAAQPQSSQDAQKYEHFVKLLYDRSYDLGKIFDNFIEFGGFDGENITLISSAIADDAAALRTHSGVLRELAQIAFGAKKFKVEKKQNGLSDIINSITKLEQTPKQPEQYQNEPAENFSSDDESPPMMPNIAPAIKSEPTQAEINRKNENEMNRRFGNPEIKDNNG